MRQTTGESAFSVGPHGKYIQLCTPYMVSVTTMQLLLNVKVTTDNTHSNACSRAPLRLYSPNRVVDQTGLTDYSCQHLRQSMERVSLCPV